MVTVVWHYNSKKYDLENHVCIHYASLIKIKFMEWRIGCLGANDFVFKINTSFRDTLLLYILCIVMNK